MSVVKDGVDRPIAGACDEAFRPVLDAFKENDLKGDEVGSSVGDNGPRARRLIDALYSVVG